MATGEKGLRFKDRVVIVTGGGSGIGRGCVEVFGENGGKVAVFDKNAESARDLSTIPGQHLFFQCCDVTKEEDVKRSIAAVVDKWGRIDCLINNAGWHPPAKEIDDFTAEEFRKLLDLNLVGYFLCCKYSLPHLRQARGSIVNIGSMAKMGQSRAVTYAATKGGISSMTKTLAVDEAKHGVRVNEVSPGAIQTPLMDEHLKSLGEVSAETLQIIKDFNLLRKFGDPREVALACLFLATDATYTTGIDLPVTAGCEVGFGVKHRE